jgi:hypothetical protein
VSPWNPRIPKPFGAGPATELHAAPLKADAVAVGVCLEEDSTARQKSALEQATTLPSTGLPAFVATAHDRPLKVTTFPPAVAAQDVSVGQEIEEMKPGPTSVGSCAADQVCPFQTLTFPPTATQNRAVGHDTASTSVLRGLATLLQRLPS